MGVPLITKADKVLYNRLRSGSRRWMILTYGDEDDWRKVKRGVAIIVENRESGKRLLCWVNDYEKMKLFHDYTDTVYVEIAVEREYE